MSVENSKIIDIVSTNAEGIVVLTISDHLEWDDESEHLLILQAKINAYLAVIESGEIYERYPGADGRPFRIEVVYKFPPNEMGVEFLKRVKRIVEGAGTEFGCRGVVGG